MLGAGVKVLEYAVVGKQPTLSPRSTAKREPLPPATIGDGTVISTGAIVFAGTTVGERCILGDQSCVRERVAIGDDVVVGRGSLVENDTTIGARTRIQANAYITAYTTLEEDVFIAPCVVTTNDNFMGRTEKRLELLKGPTVRRGARVGGGASSVRDRGRRGGVRRRRRGRHEGRARPRGRDREPRARAARGSRRRVARLSRPAAMATPEPDVHVWVRTAVDWQDEHGPAGQVNDTIRPRVELWNSLFTLSYHEFRYEISEIHGSTCRASEERRRNIGTTSRTVPSSFLSTTDNSFSSGHCRVIARKPRPRRLRIPVAYTTFLELAMGFGHRVHRARVRVPRRDPAVHLSNQQLRVRKTARDRADRPASRPCQPGLRVQSRACPHPRQASERDEPDARVADRAPLREALDQPQAPAAQVPGATGSCTRRSCARRRGRASTSSGWRG